VCENGDAEHVHETLKGEGVTERLRTRGASNRPLSVGERGVVV
jgi:hypothetical protein